MLILEEVSLPDGSVTDLKIPSDHDQQIDSQGLLALPALIDPHVHFRTPGHEHKENWVTGAKAAIAGGVTTVFDMPNNIPSCTTHQALIKKKELIDQQLESVGIDLNYKLYFGADKDHFNEIPKIAKLPCVAGIKVFMGSSTGSLLVDDIASLSEVFHCAAEYGLIVSVHAEDEATIRERKKQCKDSKDPSDHSFIRCPEAAYIATEKAISLAKKYGTKLAILHLSTKEELTLIKNAKAEGHAIFAEATPHHLFLNQTDYEKWGTCVQVNPPLRTPEDCDALWEAIVDGTIDWIGTDHAPHLKSEKDLGFGRAPSGIASIELLLPLLLNAYHQKKLTLDRLIELTSSKVREVFELPLSRDLVLIDLNQTIEVTDEMLQTKCGFSPYQGRKLSGAPVYTILSNQLFEIRKHSCMKHPN